jgi:uncharacterized protein YkwD
MGARMRLSMMVFMTLLFGCGEPVEEVDPFVFNAMELEIHDQINAYRVSQGLQELELHEDIVEVCRGHSKDMLKGTVPFGHDGFEDRVTTIQLTIDAWESGENVAWNEGYDDPATTAVEGWIDSPPHHENILSSWNMTGIGCAGIGCDGEPQGPLYFTQIFVSTP